MAIYKGFSTIGAERTRNWSLTDIELVKRDLLNHFMTRVGERVMRPTFGCRIWDYLMETTHSRDDIVEEAVAVVSAEPRVRLIDLSVADYEHGIRVEMTLEFLVVGIVDNMLVDFDARESAGFQGTNLGDFS